MAYTITNAKEDLEGILKGQSTSKLTSIFPLFNRAARQLLLDVDPQETKRIQQISNGLFDDVYDYAVPDDLKGNKIIDLRKQVNRTPEDKLTQTYSETFDIEKETTQDNLFQVAFNQGVKKVRIKKDLSAGIVLSNGDSIDSNGTWTVGDDATNLTEDNVNYVNSSASLNFDLDGATTENLENSTLSEQDLSEHEDQSSLFLWVFIPDTAIMTSVNLRWGNGAADYWDATVTTSNFGAFQVGWNILRFDWNGANSTGSPDSTAVDYLRVTINYDGTADTDFRINKTRSNLATIFEMVYYSKFFFQDGTTSAWKESAETDDDIINLDTETYNLWLWKVAEFAAQQIPDKFDINYFTKQYSTTRRRYQSLYKSELAKPRQFYYNMPRGQRDIRRALTP